MNVSALIVGGGAGERFGADTPKQLATLHGRAMIAWPADMLAVSPQIASLVLVCAPGIEDAVRAVLSPHAAGKLMATAPAGATRQESVFNGLGAVPAGTTHVLIHDAARPCLSAALRDRVLDALQRHTAVVPAVPATDTLILARDGHVDALLDREQVSGVQTPQAFVLELILRAHRTARARGFLSSDDGSLVLALGEPVATVAGERANLKVTFRDDLALAEAIFQRGVPA